MVGDFCTPRPVIHSARHDVPQLPLWPEPGGHNATPASQAPYVRCHQCARPCAVIYSASATTVLPLWRRAWAVCLTSRLPRSYYQSSFARDGGAASKNRRDPLPAQSGPHFHR
jgi:hypothetical protein